METIQRAVQAVRLHPRHHARTIDVVCGSNLSGWFDQRKLERALYNLLLNACEAAPPVGGKVEVLAAEASGAITIAVTDNGPGIPEFIREKLFHPFVSYGKENGTGLGLAVVQKIVQDHGGEIFAERTAEAKTVFRIVLAGRAQEARSTSEVNVAVPPVLPSQSENASQNSVSHPGN
jgi:signal transduction histidine kinase